MQMKSYTLLNHHLFFVFSLVQLICQVGILCHIPPSSPAFTLILILPDVFHPPHSCSSFCPISSHFHRLLPLIPDIHPQNVPVPAQLGLQLFSHGYNISLKRHVSHTPPISPVWGVSLLQTTTIHALLDVVYSPYHVPKYIYLSLSSSSSASAEYVHYQRTLARTIVHMI